MKITGTVLKTERKSGTFTNDDGRSFDYDYTIVRIVTEEGDVYEPRIPGDSLHLKVPGRGEQVEVIVTVPRATKLTISQVSALV